MPKGHKENCPCCICKAARGGHRGKDNPMYGKKGKDNPMYGVCRFGKDNPSYKHGEAGTKLHTIWVSMKGRCYNLKNSAYKYYGGRGISVHLKWLDEEKGFINFKNFALSHDYKKGLTIHRINNDKNYKPNNCCFITNSEHHKYHALINGFGTNIRPGTN